MATHVDWAALSHAYGSAVDIPSLLERALTDRRGGHIPESTWFELWSALCHQGDAYSASYAAVPFLIQIAQAPAYSAQYDPLLLAASIEVARLEGRAPALAREEEGVYHSAMRRGGELAALALKQPLSLDSQEAFAGCVAAFAGDVAGANRHWGMEMEGAV